MHDPRTFEARLTSALGRYTADEPRAVDAAALARSIAASARSRRQGDVGTRLGLRSTPRFVRLVVTLLLLAVLTGAAVVVGSQLLQRRSVPMIPPDHGVFAPTGSMAVVRERPTATLLGDGRVLVVGGYGAGALVEIWDPETGVFSAAGELLEERSGHTATLLSDGRVLVVGGSGPLGDLASAEVWDPDTMSLSATGSLVLERGRGTARLLPDGRVLVGPEPAEIWDPGTGTFSPAGSLADGRYVGDGTLLDDGRFLIIEDTGSATVLDPVTGSSGPAGSLAQARLDGFTATRLLDGRVLVAGGAACVDGDETGDVGQTAITSCTHSALGDAEFWDPSLMGFSTTGPMVRPRMLHAAVLLADGRVLLVGGYVGSAGGADTAEIFELAMEAT